MNSNLHQVSMTNYDFCFCSLTHTFRVYDALGFVVGALIPKTKQFDPGDLQGQNET